MSPDRRRVLLHLFFNRNTISRVFILMVVEIVFPEIVSAGRFESAIVRGVFESRVICLRYLNINFIFLQFESTLGWKI